MLPGFGVFSVGSSEDSAGVCLGRVSVSVQHTDNTCFRTSCKGRGMACIYGPEDL